MKKLLRFTKYIILTIFFIFATQYGWQFPKVQAMEVSQQEQKSAKRLNIIVNDIAGNIGNRNYESYENLNKTADYINGQFKNLGYSVKEQVYKAKGKDFRNIIAEIPNDSEEILIIGAHYDSCFNPGADDNASGVAGLIELARLLKDLSVEKHIRFVAFTNEEPPFFRTDLMGSRVYARSLKKSGEKIVGAIVLEMIGYYSDKINSQRYPPLLGSFYPNKGDFIAFVSNFKSEKFVKSLTSKFKEKSKFPVQSISAPDSMTGLSFSDHSSFWMEGFPAIMVTDTAYMRNKHYHKNSDFPESLNYQKMSQVIHGLSKAISSL